MEGTAGAIDGEGDKAANQSGARRRATPTGEDRVRGGKGEWVVMEERREWGGERQQKRQSRLPVRRPAQ